MLCHQMQNKLSTIGTEPENDRCKGVEMTELKCHTNVYLTGPLEVQPSYNLSSTILHGLRLSDRSQFQAKLHDRSETALHHTLQQDIIIS